MKRILVIIAAVLVCLNFMSCSSDEESNPPIAGSSWVEKVPSSITNSYSFTNNTDFTFTNDASPINGNYFWDPDTSNAVLYNLQGDRLWRVQFNGNTAQAYEDVNSQIPVEYMRQ